MTAPDFTPGIDLRTLAQMRARGLDWLADIVEDMLGGDPYQEGTIGFQILEEYRKQIPASDA